MLIFPSLSATRATTVGASLLAKNVNDNACILNKRGAYEFFASKLAPTRTPPGFKEDSPLLTGFDQVTS
ncbi:hypothetical protein CIB54_20480 [Pseudomonas fluorescens]|uniref:Uncharacterized protein n=1 Tax=Pseudomonas fluorescens TaxID=294 RepID=A0A2N1E066_PSEFL|nr:hypothetical protein CIB54_20480 [Pseudomonas fluorescens]